MFLGSKEQSSFSSGLQDNLFIQGFDGMDISCYYNPGISTIKQPKKEMAEKSVEILFELLKGNGENKHILLDTELLERESSSCINKK